MKKLITIALLASAVGLLAAATASAATTTVKPYSKKRVSGPVIGMKWTSGYYAGERLVRHGRTPWGAMCWGIPRTDGCAVEVARRTVTNHVGTGVRVRTR